ncbi:glutamate receptor 2 [Biomphalaria pfeifferi]|uniref:Glutamate receptor 2 n=1 Tax=Biomphalaria pfeifferi TaxID=112525 RepID=A0AAD8F458_BIOPF|nr:glutamate receptor 2 [Biomphalaria pfeifferi]
MKNSGRLSLVVLCILSFNEFNFVQSAKESVIVVVISDVIATNNQNMVPILKEITNYFRPKGQSTDVRFVPVVTSKNLTETVDIVCDLLATGMSGLIDLSPPKLSPLLRALCQDLNVAYVLLVDNSYHFYMADRLESNGTHVAIEPVSYQMLQIVVDIAEKEQLNSIALFYDETFDIQNTPRRVLTNVPVPHIYLPLSNNASQTEQQIDTMIKINIKTVMVIADRFNVQNFLSLLTRKRIINFDPNIFVLTKDAKLNCPSCQANLRLLLMTAKQSTDAQLQFIEFMRTSRIDAELETDKIKVDEAYVYDVARLVIDAVDSLTKLGIEVDTLKDLDCNNETQTSNPDHVIQSQALVSAVTQSSVSGVFGALSWKPRDGVLKYNLSLTVSEVLFEQGIQKSKVQIAEWTQTGHLKMSVPSLLKVQLRRHYRVVTIPGIPPFVYKSTNDSASIEYSGFCIDLLEKIAELVDFDYSIYDTDQVGSVDDTGQWSGAIRELIDGRADIAVGPISVMNERETVIDFTVPYYDLVGLTILMKKPKVDYSLVKFLSVMDEEVWGCIIGAFVLFSVLICVFDRLSPFSYQNRKSQWRGEGEEPRIFTLKEGIWFCMMSLTPQGGGETPKALSGRLIAATWWLFGFIIIATYTANLAAFLTVSRLETPIESLDDLSKQVKVQYAPENGSMAMIYFRRMADIESMFYEIWKNMTLKSENIGSIDKAQLAVWDYPVSDKYTKLWDTMNKNTFPVNVEAAIKRVVNEDFAFIADATTNKYQALINCDVMEVGEEFSRKPYALAIREGSPMKNELNNAILRLINNRTLEELKSKWWKKDAKECSKDEDESDGISIRNIGGVFLVIVIGSALSLITLALECYWYRVRPKRRNKKSTTSGSQPTFSDTSFTSGYEADKNGTRETNMCSDSASDMSGPEFGVSNRGFESSESYVVTGKVDHQDVGRDVAMSTNVHTERL